MLAKRHRDMARLRNKHCTRLHVLLLELEAGGISSEISVNKAKRLLDTVIVDGEVIRHRVLVANELIDDIARLDVALKASKKRIAAAVSASGTTLTEIVGIGPVCAAIIIGFTGDIARFETKNHFATYNATAPIEASSGGRTRHRLNPRGNGKLNHAIQELGHVSVTFHQQSQHPGMAIAPDVGHPIRSHRSYRDRPSIVGVVLI